MNYSKEEKDFIVEKYRDNTRNEVVKMFEEEFNKSITPQSVSNIANKYKNYKKDNKKYKQEHIDYLKEIYAKYPLKKCIELLKNKFNNFEATEHQLRTILNKYKIHSNRDTKFKKGQKLSPEHYEKIKKTMFKKGQKPHHHHPIGYEKKSRNGYIFVKIKDDCYENSSDNWKYNWKSKARLIYEQHHGPVPENHYIIFADGDKYNFDIDNLIIVSKRELFYMNANKLYLKDDKKLNKQTLAIAKLKLKIFDKEKELKNAKSNT